MRAKAAKKGKKRHSFRLLCLALIFVVWMVAIIWRLAYLQVSRHDHYYARAEAQRTDTIAVSPLRGSIVDRNGQELARSVDADSVFVYIREIKDPEKVARSLAPLLGEREGEMMQKLTGTTRRFAWLKRKVDFDTAKAISAAIDRFKLSGVHFVKEPQRHYPNGALAAHLLGYVNIDEKGQAGLELVHDDKLRGKPGTAFFETDGRRQPVTRQDNPAMNGGRVVTTIDSNLQHQVESILERIRRATKAKSLSAIVLDPKTGEILAMANAPDFDPNQRPKHSGDKEEDTNRRNRAITDVYEPGSVFKIVTYSGVIEEGLARPDEKIDCQGGQITLHGRVIKDAHPHGVLTVAEALAKSSNIGAIKLAQRLGEERLADYVTRFGFGRKTGVDLPGEVSGLVNPLKWQGTSYASIAMGHEVGVTALQVISAMATIANGGVWVKPHIVRQVMAEDNRVIYEAQPESRRVIREDTATTIAGMLEDVVARGTARNKVRLAGYKAAGKTGTAQKVMEGGGYSNTKYIASFAGFVPATKPRFAIIVTLDEPVGAHQGGQVAAPVFSEIAEAALTAYLVKPDSEEYQQQIARLQEKARTEAPKIAATPEAETVKTEAKTEVRKDKKEVIAAALPKKAQPKAPPEAQEKKPGTGQKSAAIATRKPEPKKAEPKDREIVVSKNDPDKQVRPKQAPNTQPTGAGVMPDLRGRSLRAVAQVCSNLDLKLRAVGSGVVAHQSPSPGVRVKAGEVCKVEFQ